MQRLWILWRPNLSCLGGSQKLSLFSWYFLSIVRGKEGLETAMVDRQGLILKPYVRYRKGHGCPHWAVLSSNCPITDECHMNTVLTQKCHPSNHWQAYLRALLTLSWLSSLGGIIFKLSNHWQAYLRALLTLSWLSSLGGIIFKLSTVLLTTGTGFGLSLVFPLNKRFLFPGEVWKTSHRLGMKW